MRKTFRKIICRNPTWKRTASDVKISAAADFLGTDIYMFTKIPGPKRKMAWIKYAASCICDDKQPEYNAIYLDHSVLHLGHTYRTDSCEFMLCVMPNINT